MEEFVKKVAEAARSIKRDRVLIAIDGRCGAGKTTFADRLSAEFDAPVIHMDDFFLRPEKRTPDRLAEPGGNVDRERVLEEVLISIRKTGKCRYRPYDCSTGDLAEAVEIPEKAFYIIEGSYSCHPELWDYYDLHIFLTVHPPEQMRRIISREGEEKSEMFRTRWIPMEEKYFNTFGIAEKCEFIYESRCKMDTIRLGRTNLTVTKNGFGALPVQRVGIDEGCRILRKAYDGGINYFDTARAYTDSEEKIGLALSDVRENIIISTKTMSRTVDGFWEELHTSLRLLKTDYIDIYQFHNPPFCPKPGDGTGLYEAMLEAKEKGLIRHIGMTNHRLSVATEAVESGLYDTLQFPFSYLAGEKEEALVRLCEERDVGFICMKALAGGLITRSDVAYAYLANYPVAPIWGIQKESELDEFLSYNFDPPALNGERMECIRSDREELAGEFCRGCGYCMPCPTGIEISMCARMSLLLRRSPAAGHLSEKGQARMQKIEDCTNCGQCKTKCPYGLDTPELLRRNLEDYKTFL